MEKCVADLMDERKNKIWKYKYEQGEITDASLILGDIHWKLLSLSLLYYVTIFYYLKNINRFVKN